MENNLVQHMLYMSEREKYHPVCDDKFAVRIAQGKYLAAVARARSMARWASGRPLYYDPDSGMVLYGECNNKQWRRT